jgi:hypothetical protein
MNTSLLARRRLLASSLVVLTATGFAACTFGAGDFEIVAASDTTSGGSNGAGGTGEGGGGSGGLGEGGNGTGATGAGGDGTGGSGPAYLCTPGGNPFTVFSASDLAGFNLESELVRVVSTGDNSAVVAVQVSEPATPNMPSTVMLRGVSDSGGGQVHNIVTVNNGEHFRLGAVVVRGSEVFVNVGGSVIEEYRFTISNQGTSLAPSGGAPAQVPLPVDCLPAQMGRMRDYRASYEGPLSFALTCEQGINNFALYLGAGMPIEFLPVTNFEPSEINNIVRHYTKVGSTHVMFVGPDGPDKTIGLRMGPDAAALGDMANFAITNEPDRATWAGFRGQPDGSGLAMFGASITMADPNPPIVPADFFGGFITDLASLTDVPPPGLTKIGSYTKGSEIFLTSGYTVVGDLMYTAGVSFQPLDRLGMTLMNKDGQVLTRNAVIYQAPEGTIIDDKASGDIAPMGIGTIVTWVENDEVKARLINCSPN